MEQIGKHLMTNINDELELQDFIHGDNLDQYMNLIREGHYETPIFNNLNLDFMNGCLVEIPEDPSAGEYIVDSNVVMNSDPNSLFSTLESFNSILKEVENEEEEEDDTSVENSSFTTSKKPKVDRSRTLISERRRRGRMKEKLYALRSLVPNITKMDKASIVGDAVLYVKELQMQAKKLKAEISLLESSLNETQTTHRNQNQNNIIQPSLYSNQFLPTKIIQLDVFQVEERGFYLRLVCKMGERVAMSLYKVLESLTTFIIQSSNLASASDRFILTATINVRDCGVDMNLPNMKLWLTGALLNHGFEF